MFRTGIPLRIGPFVYSFRILLHDIIEPISFLYAQYPVELDAPFIDFRMCASRHAGPRGWLANQTYLSCNGDEFYSHTPRSTFMAMWEWGINRCVWRYANQYLLLHSAVVERNGRALLLIGEPEAGKSTLCSLLAYNGWRFFSDELAIIDPSDRQLRAHPKPIILKNESISVVRHLITDAPLGPICKNTAKGTVAHLKPTVDAVRRMNETARPTWIAFVKYQNNSRSCVEPMNKGFAAMWTAKNAFNYGIYGKLGFDIVTEMVEGCDCFRFTYSDTEEALTFFNQLSSGNGTAEDLSRELRLA
jgi:HprK-related kinase A